MSPWCLSTFTATGEPTASAKKFWNEYNGIPRKIAFENGKPVAFSSEKPESLGGWHTLDGVQVYVAGEFMPTGEIVTSIDKDAVSGEKKEEWIKKGYIYPNLIYARSYQLTDKGVAAFEKQKQEAWWDMEDQRAQDTLSDSIVSEPRKNQPELPDGVPLENDDFQADWEDMAGLYDETEFGFGIPEGNQHQLTQAEIEELPFFTTPSGEIYGFVDKDNNIYLDETVITPEHPMHEYTHLWDKIVSKNNPELWKRGVELMKKTGIWNQLAEDDNYGGKWKRLNISGDRLDSLIASEVHARLVGENGEKLLDQIAKEKGHKNIVQKLRDWILEMWKNLKSTFGSWSKDELDKLTLADFNHMTVRDFANGIDLLKINNSLTKKIFNTKEEADAYIDDLV